MRLYYTLCEDADGYHKLEKISLVPIKNCYYKDLKENEVFDLSEDELTPYNHKIKQSLVILIVGMHPFIYNFVEVYKNGNLISTPSYNKLYLKIDKFLKECETKKLNMDNIVDEFEIELEEMGLPVDYEFFDKYTSV